MSISYVYVVNYYNPDGTGTTTVGVFQNHNTAVDYVTVNSSHSFSHDLNSGGCDICRKMICDDEIEYVCTQCANYHLCINCFKPHKMKHCCKIEEELLEIKRYIKNSNYAEADIGSYTIENVKYVK
jgi:hypothetical protein